MVVMGCLRFLYFSILRIMTREVLLKNYIIHSYNKISDSCFPFLGSIHYSLRAVPYSLSYRKLQLRPLYGICGLAPGSRMCSS